MERWPGRVQRKEQVMNRRSVLGSEASHGTVFPITRDLSRRLATLSFVTSCLVVFIHSVLTSSPDSWLGCFEHEIKRYADVAVPVFFFLSGFFLAGHFGESGWWGREVEKRVRTLLVPYVVWSLIGAVLAWGLDPLLWKLSGNGGTWTWPTLGDWLNLLGVNVWACRTPLVGVLWYVRSLFVLVVLSPLWAWAFYPRRHWGWGVLILSLAVAGWWLVHPWSHVDDWRSLWSWTCPPRGLLYMALGAGVRCWNWDLGKIPRWAGCLALVLCVVIAHVKPLVAGYDSIAFILRIAMHFCGILTGVALVGRLPLPKGLAATSFAIYLVHPFVVEHLHMWLTWRWPHAFIPVALAGIGAGIVVYHGIRWLSPRAAYILFGGRG